MNRNMELYESVKKSVLNYKLELCCCLAPIRIGLLVIGYFNVFMALLFLVSVADDVMTPPLMAAQAKINEDTISKPLGILAYSTELAFNTLLLCGLYRKDVVLLNVYMYFLFVSIIASLLVYSVVIAAIPVLIQLVIVLDWAFLWYLILLVRSAIVEIKQIKTSEKNGLVILHSVVQKSDELPMKETKVEQDIEVEVKSEDESEDSKDEMPHPERKKDELPKLDTINESKKENINIV